MKNVATLVTATSTGGFLLLQELRAIHILYNAKIVHPM